MTRSNVLLFLTSALLLLLSVLVESTAVFIWIALAPALVLIRKLKLVPGVLIGTLLGIIYHSVLLFWINDYEIRIFAMVLVLATPFFGLFTGLTLWLSRKWKNELVQILAPPAAWSFVSFVYSFTPIDIIGDQIALFSAVRFPQIISAAGLAGLAFLILLSNSFAARWFESGRKLYRNLFFLLIVSAAFLLPDNRPPAGGNPVKVALVQHNFPISNDWRFEHKNEVLARYVQAVKEYGPKADLVIFPQYGLPVDVLREPDWLETLAKENQTSILLATYLPKIPGGSLREGPRTDSALLFTPDGGVQEYQAVTPPPFRSIGQVLGRERKPLIWNGNKLGILLCYEDARPDEARARVKSGAEILIALSNPGHFLKTPLPRFHLLHTRVRAIETGRWVVRVSPNGFSAVIDPNGEIVTASKLNREEVLLADVYPVS